MNTLFEELNVNYILIEESTNTATVDVHVKQNGTYIPTKLVLDFTDLNQLFLKLSTQGIEVSLSENFNCYQTENGNLYTLNMQEYGWDTIAISNFHPMHHIQQIRA